MPVSKLGRKGLVSLHVCLTVRQEVVQELEAGARRRDLTQRPRKSAACSVLHVLLTCFLIAPGSPPCQRDTTHRELVSSASIVNEENVPQAVPQASLAGVFSQLRVPRSPDDPSLLTGFKLTDSS